MGWRRKGRFLDHFEQEFIGHQLYVYDFLVLVYNFISHVLEINLF
jgi:hypothetical protein